MASKCLLLSKERRKQKKRLLLGASLWMLQQITEHKVTRSCWVKPWITRRLDYGAFHTLVSELAADDQGSYLNFLRVTPNLFDDLLVKVTPYIERQDTNYRKSISAGTRLAITLRFLATVCVEKLNACPKLCTLKLNGNNLDHVSNLECCSQLWNLDLANNQIRSLEGLSRFVALGTLVLSNNALTWQDLSKIRHMHILHLSLHGNPQLEKDPYYRIHVIDSLPNVWMLDGRMVTSAERLQVQHFFQDSALTDHPVRHKLKKEHFTPTGLKKIQVTGVFGEQTVHLMRRFPVNAPLNTDLDKQRVKYLAYAVQQDIFLDYKALRKKLLGLHNHHTFLEELITNHSEDKERSNMLLLLLVASLEFAIPSFLMKETLESSKLSEFGGINTMDLFLLRRETRVQLVSLLLSAVKIDRDMGLDGGLYDKLYMALYHLIADLVKLAQGCSTNSATQPDRPKSSKKSQNLMKQYKSVLASEVVQLMCIVPAFFDYITKDTGVMSLVSVATCDQQMVFRVKKSLKKLERNKCEVQQVYEEIATLLMAAIEHKVRGGTIASTYINGEQDNMLLKKRALPRRPQSSPIKASDYHTSGRASPDKRHNRIKSANKIAMSNSPRASLGDQVLLGPQNVARIISIPEPDILLVQMDVVPADNGAMVKNRKKPEEHYSYVDKDDLYYDYIAGYWRPLGTVGDRITIQVCDELDAHRMKTSGSGGNLPTTASSLDSVLDERAMVLASPASKQTKQTVKSVSAQLMEHLSLQLEVPPDEMNPYSSKPTQPNNPGCFLSIEGTKPPKIQEIRDVGQAHDAMILVSDDYPQDLTKQKTPSCHTSLESIEEPELNMEHMDSPPSTAMGPKSVVSMSMETASLGTEELPIEIPHGMLESASAGHTTLIDSVHSKNESCIMCKEQALCQLDVGKDLEGMEKTSNENEQEEEICTSTENKKDTQEMVMTAQPQSVSSLETYKMIASPYQSKRLEAWKPRAVSAGTAIKSRPPPQRPSSPTGEVESQWSVLHIQKGNDWLAGGKDVFWQSMKTRPDTCHVPGWKEGLPPRPKSAAAVRALKRSKPPAITTPSSIAYDQAYGIGSQQPKTTVGQIYHNVDRATMEQIFALEHAKNSTRILPAYPVTTHTHAGLKEELMCEVCIKNFIAMAEGRKQEMHSLPPLVPALSNPEVCTNESGWLHQTQFNEDISQAIGDRKNAESEEQGERLKSVSWADANELPEL